MPARPKNAGLIYLRRSSGRQELSLPRQMEWAIDEAAREGVAVDASIDDLQYMQQHHLSSHKSIRLDDAITGANLSRPGFLALNADALADRKISHIFIYRRDRFARPEEAHQMVMVEKKLRHSGITIQFSDKTAAPLERGQDNIAEDLGLYFEYYESGSFLRKLSENVIASHRKLALDGFRTGGNPPYGFARYLVDGGGNLIQELPPGRRVRQDGCHVRIKPKDMAKIQVWLLILELKGGGWGFKRIATHLNQLEIPSPDSGRTRTDQGVPHRVSGKWNSNTVRDLCKNAAILGLQEYGRRSEGEHRRLSADGYRFLTEQDRNSNDKPKCIDNGKEVIITGAIGSEALYGVEKWNAIQSQIEERGKSQRGIPRVKKSEDYPLSCRVVDLTDQCGAIMYARTSGKRRLYT